MSGRHGMTRQAERSRLDALTRHGKPKDRTMLIAVLEHVEGIRDHANERAAFYATDLADEWDELAVEVEYRLEAIQSNTWAWS
jgi:hypothetical protein